MKSDLTEKYTTPIHTDELQQQLFGENYKLAKVYGLDNQITTCVNVQRACMPTETGSEPTTT